jgi:probable HAF family extracellular repeat protein
VVIISEVVGSGSQPVAMNARGQVVGNGGGGPWIYDSATARVTRVLPSYETRTFVANGISANGDVALDLVGTDASGKTTHHAFRSSNGNLVDLGTLGGGYSSAKVINGAAVVAGDATLASGDFRAFLFDGNMRSLGTLGGIESLAFAINEHGSVTGQAQLASGPRHAFRYDGAMHDLGSLGGAFARGQAINESGQVAGMSTLDPSANDPVHAFFHDGKTMKDLGVLPGLPWSSATGLNDSGVVVGNVYAEINEDDYDTHAFVYRDGKMWDLNDLIPKSTFKLFTSLSIDGAGRILCTDGQVGQMPANGYLLVPN